MNGLVIQALIALSLYPLSMSQSKQAASPSTTSQPSPEVQQAGNGSKSKAVVQREQAIENARTICIHSETVFLTVSTLERALLKQKNWDQLGLNIVGEVGGSCNADLQIDVDRLHLTHIHTYVLSDKTTGTVLTAGRIRAFDGVVASDPMAERIVKLLSTARLKAQAPDAGSSF